MRQDRPQSQSNGELEGTHVSTIVSGGCCSQYPRSYSGSTNHTVKNRPEMTTQAFSFSPLSSFIPWYYPFLQRQLIPAPRTQLPSYQVWNFKRFSKVIEPQVLLPRELIAVCVHLLSFLPVFFFFLVNIANFSNCFGCDSIYRKDTWLAQVLLGIETW